MIEEIRKNILEILEKAIVYYNDHDGSSLRKLSNHSIHQTSIYQDKDSITIAVVLYALSKIVRRSDNFKAITDELEKALFQLREKNFESYEDSLSRVVDLISVFDKKMDFYIRHIINQAGIKKGSRIYEDGISLARTAEIFNLTQWELMKYIGQTKIADRFAEDGLKIEDRIDYTRKLFGI